MKATTTGLIGVLLAGIGVWAAADDPAMGRQASKGTVIVVSDLDRADFEQEIAALRPQYVLWAEPGSDRAEVTMPAAGLAMILYLLTNEGGPSELHPSWAAELPVSLEGFPAASIVIAAKVVQPPEKPTPRLYVPALVMAPTRELVHKALAEAMRMPTFPLNGPVVHEVADLRDVRSIACLPVIGEGYYGGLATAAESALYRGLLELNSFRVVGRDTAEIALVPAALTADRTGELARRYSVQAIAYVDITRAETRCEEQTRYRKTSRTSISADRQREFEREKAKAEAEGKGAGVKSPTPDLIWAAEYRARQCTTRVAGTVKIVDAATAALVMSYEIGDSEVSVEEDAPRTIDYRWYRRDDVNRASRFEHTYIRPLDLTLAGDMVRSEVARFVEHLRTRALLPTAEENFAALDTASDGKTRVRVLSIDGEDVFIDLGEEHSARRGDAFSLWGEKTLKHPDTGEIIEIIRARQSTVVVAEVYQRTSLCQVIKRSDERPLQVGDELVMD